MLQYLGVHAAFELMTVLLTVGVTRGVTLYLLFLGLRAADGVHGLGELKALFCGNEENNSKRDTVIVNTKY